MTKKKRERDREKEKKGEERGERKRERESKLATVNNPECLWGEGVGTKNTHSYFY